VPPEQASELSETGDLLCQAPPAPPESKKFLEEGRLGMVATDSSAMATMVAKKFLEDAALAWLPPIPRLRWRPASACFDFRYAQNRQF
jgi:hypothetical protein